MLVTLQQGGARRLPDPVLSGLESRRLVKGALTALTFLCGCASASEMAGSTRSSADVITRAEIVEAELPMALDVIRQLRPSWLRGLDRGQCIMGYLGEENIVNPPGTPPTQRPSRNVRSADLAAIRYYRPGRPHPGGGLQNGNCAAIQYVLLNRR